MIKTYAKLLGKKILTILSWKLLFILTLSHLFCHCQNDVRIAVKDYESQRAKMYGPVDLWHHENCFVENREELGFEKSLNVEKWVLLDQTEH